MKILKQHSLEDCIKAKLLRKIPPSTEKAERSIKISRKWLIESEKNLKNNTFNSSILSSYLAMFHSARAILFFDGFREKSHYCIARYLEEKYVNKKFLENKWINLLDHYRNLRHNGQYSISFFTTKKEAENALYIAKEFVERMNKLLKKLKETERK